MACVLDQNTIEDYFMINKSDLKEKKIKAVAFYDLDGTLCSATVVHGYSFFARNQPTLLKSIVSTTSLMASIPFFLLADMYSRKFFNEIFYRRYKNESEYRLKIFAQDLFEEVIKPTIYKQSYDMIEQSRRAGFKQVLVTGALDILAKPVVKHFKMDDFVANELEYVKGYSTGKIKQPLIAGASKANWIRQYVKKHNFDLEQCLAYSDSFSDYPMLAVVGKPSVVNPDRRLKQLAQSFDWPILRFQ